MRYRPTLSAKHQEEVTCLDLLDLLSLAIYAAVSRLQHGLPRTRKGTIKQEEQELPSRLPVQIWRSYTKFGMFLASQNTSSGKMMQYIIFPLHLARRLRPNKGRGWSPKPLALTTVQHERSRKVNQSIQLITLRRGRRFAQLLFQETNTAETTDDTWQRLNWSQGILFNRSDFFHGNVLDVWGVLLYFCHFTIVIRMPERLVSFSRPSIVRLRIIV